MPIVAVRGIGETVTYDADRIITALSRQSAPIGWVARAVGRVRPPAVTRRSRHPIAVNAGLDYAHATYDPAQAAWTVSPNTFIRTRPLQKAFQHRSAALVSQSLVPAAVWLQTRSDERIPSS